MRILGAELWQRQPCFVAAHSVPGVHHSPQFTTPPPWSLSFLFLCIYSLSNKLRVDETLLKRNSKRNRKRWLYRFSPLSSTLCLLFFPFSLLIADLSSAQWYVLIGCHLYSWPKCGLSGWIKQPELSVALRRINNPAAIIWLYKDEPHTLSLTLHLFLKHVWKHIYTLRAHINS